MSYSYSKLSTFDECPFKYKLKYIDKIESPFTNNPIFEKGKYIHALLEHYPSIPEFEFEFEECKSKKDVYLATVKSLLKSNKILKFLLNTDVSMYREKQFYLDYNFKEISTREDSFLNGVIDYVGKHNDILLLVDWKTGKTQNHASLNQLKFYSLWAFNNLDISAIQCSLFFIEQNCTVNLKIERSELNEIETLYKSKINTIENEKEFKKKRTKSCEYCPYINECQRINLRR